MNRDTLIAMLMLGAIDAHLINEAVADWTGRTTLLGHMRNAGTLGMQEFFWGFDRAKTWYAIFFFLIEIAGILSFVGEPPAGRMLYAVRVLMYCSLGMGVIGLWVQCIGRPKFLIPPRWRR